MKHVRVLSLVAGSALAFSASGQGSSPMEKLGFLVGRWSAAVTTYDRTTGDRQGEVASTVEGRWGGGSTWLAIDSQAASYAVHVVVYFDARRQRYAAFSINTFGQAGSYWGSWEDGALVLTGSSAAAGDQLQRVRYQPLPDGGVRFRVEQSSDGGAHYRPLSEAVWTPAAEGGPE